MALKITFDDKVTKNVSTDEENKKITANNINEIKQVVNLNADELQRGAKIACVTAVKNDEDITLTEKEVLFDIKMNKIKYNNSKFQLSEDGGIVCPYDGTILVTASAHFTRNGYCGLFLYANKKYIYFHGEPAGNPNYGTIEMSNKPITVKSGDIIYLKTRTTVANDKVIADDRTRLTVMYIDYD